MSRAAATCIVLSGMVLAVGGCHRSPAPQSPPATTTVTTPASATVVVLTADQPTARIRQPRQPAANTIRLRILTVTNPTLQGLAFSLDVETISTPAQTAHVGDFTNFPADQPGDFTLPLPAPAADLIHEGPTNVVITVSSGLPGTALQPRVRVSINAIVLAT